MSHDLPRPREQSLIWHFWLEPFTVNYGKPITILSSYVLWQWRWFQWLKRKILDTLVSICHYCLSLKDIAWKQTAYHINNSDNGHTRLKQQSKKFLKITSVSLSKNIDEKEKNKKCKDNCKAFCVTRTRNKLRFSCFALVIVFNVEYQLKSRKIKLVRRKNLTEDEKLEDWCDWYFTFDW